MTDKVQKIREEVVGIINSINLFTPDEDGKNSSYEAGKLDVASKILQVIDSLQEEPKECMYSKANYTNDDRLTLCKDCKELCKYNQKTAAESLGISQEVYDEIVDKCLYGSEVELVDDGDLPKEEPVSEDLEEAANNAVIALVPSFGQKYSDGSYVSSCRDSFKREELIELFKAGANWQERKDEKNIGELQWNAHAEGWDECKQEMMKDAIDGLVVCNNLTHWFKDIVMEIPSFLNVGEKVKVIILKEN